LAASTPTPVSSQPASRAGHPGPTDPPGSPRPAGGGPDRGPGRATRLGLTGISLIAVVLFAIYAAWMASRVDEVAVGDPVPIIVPGDNASGPFGTGLTAPDFALQTADGQPVRLSDFAGRPVWINVWASWCAPCRAEMPDIQQVHRELQEKNPDVVLLLVSLGENPADVQRYLQSTGYDLPVLVDPDFSFTQGYRVTGLPTHYFIDRQGIIRDYVIGSLKPNGMRARLATIAG
jgi:cytochrome c biogenesis protein CcmG/thiol:disulfide interchange protein DsbE